MKCNQFRKQAIESMKLEREIKNRKGRDNKISRQNPKLFLTRKFIQITKEKANLKSLLEGANQFWTDCGLAKFKK